MTTPRIMVVPTGPGAARRGVLRSGLGACVCVAVAVAAPGAGAMAQCPPAWGSVSWLTTSGVGGMLELPGGDLLVGSSNFFFGVLPDPAYGLARYRPATKAWTWGLLDPSFTADVYCLAAMPDGGVAVGGIFGALGGVLGAGNVARYDPASNTVSALAGGTNGPVFAAAATADGRLVVGGSFSSAGGVAASRVAVYAPATGSWSALGSGVTGGAVLAIGAEADGRLVVGGFFSSAGGVAGTGRLARFDPASGQWSALGVIPSAGSVEAVVVLPGGDLLVGGSFSSVNGLVGTANLARYGAASGVWTGLGANGRVRGLSLTPDGRVLVAGDFTGLGGAGGSRITRFDPASGVFAALGTGAEQPVDEPLQTAAGEVYIAGEFSRAGATVSPFMARFGPTPTPSMDGTADCAYGPALATQTTATQFGNSTLGQVGAANGSELDVLRARFEDGTLYLHLAGNLESNFNRLEVFIDHAPGGQNTLRGDNANIDFNGLNRMGAFGLQPGLTFDAGFAPDLLITMHGGGTPYQFFVHGATLPTGGQGSGAYLGSTGAASDGLLVGGGPLGGFPFNTVYATINNSNTAGVVGGSGASSGAGVTTGVELAVYLGPLACGDLRVCAFVNGTQHQFVSNQFLPPLPPGTNNLGEPRTINLASIPGVQYALVPGQTSSAPVLTVQPAATRACVGGIAELSVQAPGLTVPSYQWEQEPPGAPGVWVPMFDGPNTVPLGGGVSGVVSIVDGANERTLRETLLSGPGLAWNGGRRRCVVINACGSTTSEAVFVRLCRADFDCSGGLTPTDIFAFLSAYFAGDQRADFNGDGSRTPSDIFAFLNAYFAGC